jgi:cbb3-type cytochrome oxidase maturation protein
MKSLEYLMEVIYGLLPGMLLLGIIGVAVFFWAVRNGQYDDMDGAANRVLMDDDDMSSSSANKDKQKQTETENNDQSKH